MTTRPSSSSEPAPAATELRPVVLSRTPPRGYSAHVAHTPEIGTDTAAMLAAVNITVTEEGKQRARRRLREARERWTPELDSAVREQLGLTDRTAA